MRYHPDINTLWDKVVILYLIFLKCILDWQNIWIPDLFKKV